MTAAKLRTLGLLVAATGAGLFAPRTSRAQQIDVNPPLPNTLILLDTSGSMEMMLDGNPPESEGQACYWKYSGTSVIKNPAQTNSLVTPATGTTPNRWGIAVQSLTGDVAPVYNCVEMPRAAGSQFTTEYQINKLSPYDTNYFLPYHRPVSGGNANQCLVAPGVLPGVIAGLGVGSPPSGIGGKATDWPAGAIANRLLVPSGSQTCTFTQASNGILDSARDMIRFGLMTYDQDTASGTGVDSIAQNVINTPTTPFDGSWSYFDGWNSSGGNPIWGEPADCTNHQTFELGARNPAAPPWEGRFITLPSDPNAPIATVETQNDQIQQAIAAMRPYGATPTAAMFADAEYYYWSDPSGPQKTDPYVQGSCRDEYIIHITDGAPNQDLRPACSNKPVDSSKPGTCPYKLPEEIAAELALGSGGKHPVKTFVIGFAVSSVQNGTTPVKCADLVKGGTLDPTYCSSGADPKYAPCCELERIAIAGGTNNAYFADTPGDLNKALGAIVASIAQNTTTRTVPAYSPIVANPAGGTSSKVTNSSLYLASFSPIPGKPWEGTVQRQRFVCTYSGSSFSVPPPVVDTTHGDDYATDLALQSSRQFRTVKAEAVSGNVDSGATIRMQISATLPGVHGDDHLGTYGAASALIGPGVSNLTTGLTAAHLNIGAKSCPNTLNNEWLSADSCKNLALNFATAQASTDPMPDYTFTPFQSRATTPMADIFHATPVVVPPPSALLRDESYQSFATAWATRKTVVYAATNDGLLHAFNANVVDDGTTRDTAELWAFMPPAVMPKLLSSYPGSHQLLLDGSPVVRDAVFDRDKSTTSLLAATNWHTALVAGFGSQSKGYYALDVTDPAPNSDLTKGPQFLWQLTTMPKLSNGNADRELFGAHSATPAITTVFVDLDNTGNPHEVGVAILPGGIDGGPVTGKCKRAASAGNDAAPLTGFARRDYVRCWAASGANVPGRSVTVVRLDTGEVLRTFSRLADAPQALIDAKRVGTAETPLDSPMTGVPVVYPADAGSVAQKVFIGDADGTIWRFNLTDPHPENWTGQLFLDAYNGDTDKNASPDQDGQPVQISPVVALDRLGQVVVGFATGDQETFTSTGLNYVYSLTETTASDNTLRAKVNWYLPFTSGERASGPMGIFDGVLYFASYAAATTGSAVCSGGTAKMWGRDYTLPKDSTDLSLGGVPKLQSPLGATNPAPDYILPGVIDPTVQGKVIPGVSVNFTPSCADVTTATDQYTGGSHALASQVSSGSYSLVAPVGTKNGQGGVKVLNNPSGGGYGLGLPTPKTATIVDSWASVVE